MSTASSHKNRVSSPISYVPAASAAEQVAEAIGCIITGRPLPAHLSAAPVPVARPATVSEGISRILAGGR
jgi:hypothetical protein